MQCHQRDKMILLLIKIHITFSIRCSLVLEVDVAKRTVRNGKEIHTRKWNGASVRAQRLPRPRPERSGASDRLLRGRRTKKLHVCRRRHGRHRRLVPTHFGRRRRPVPMSSPRLRMSLFLRVVSLLVLSFLSHVLSVDCRHAHFERVFFGWPF